METGNSYNVALFISFVPYILFEGKRETNENALGGVSTYVFAVPSNIIIKRIAPSTWLAGIMTLWGKSVASKS
jgi:hypothetical protein